MTKATSCLVLVSAKLVEQLIPTPEGRSLNPIGDIIELFSPNSTLQNMLINEKEAHSCLSTLTGRHKLMITRIFRTYFSSSLGKIRSSQQNELTK